MTEEKIKKLHELFGVALPYIGKITSITQELVKQLEEKKFRNEGVTSVTEFVGSYLGILGDMIDIAKIYGLDTDLQQFIEKGDTLTRELDKIRTEYSEIIEKEPDYDNGLERIMIFPDNDRIN